MAEQKRYWKGMAELDGSVSMEELGKNEFPQEIPVDEFLGNAELLSDSQTTRRDFLKYLGFSTAAATLAACEAPVVESIPYVVKPDELIPGVPSYYASAYYDGHDFASVLIKTREGRPIKLEPNTDSPFNGATNARVQGSVLSLYDNGRLKEPMLGGAAADMDKVDSEVKAKIAGANSVVVLSHSVNSPSYTKMMQVAADANPAIEWIQYDSVDYSGKLNAWAKMTGKRALPSVDLAKARVVVAVGSDFLASYNGQSVSKAYADRREPGKGMSRHYQFESNMSLAGANADHRTRVRASEQGQVILALYNAIARLSGQSTLKAAKVGTAAKNMVDQAARDLMRAKGESLVINGLNDEAAEMLTAGINQMLMNEGTTVLTDKRLHVLHGNEDAFNGLVDRMKSGNVDVLILDRVNPVYDRAGFEQAIGKAKYVVALNDRLDETASYANAVVPSTHYLENWSDQMPVDGYLAMTQPVIRPLFSGSRQAEESLMAFMGMDGSYHDFIKSNLSSTISSNGGSWGKLVHDGFMMTATASSAEMEGEESASSDMSASMSAAAGMIAAMSTSGREIVFYEKSGMGTGTLSNNPWLQEMPDPITRTSWDNYLTVSPADAIELGVKNSYKTDGSMTGSRVNIKVNGVTINDVPVLVQPGQAYGTVGMAVGYGRTKAGKAGNNVGFNAYSMMKSAKMWSEVDITASGASDHEFACIQLHHTMMGRDIVKEVSLDTFLNEPAKGEGGWNNRPEFETYKGPLASNDANLWQDFDHETGHFWNLSIDLNKCTGCGACVIACHAENNVPVVGKDEIRRSRDMHWLRIDRYYSSDMTEERAEEEGIGAIDKFKQMENPAEEPQVVFQPVMCQHCNHAPCETVCPVAATSHSAEGLNHMAYNRCIGTRYCANNCPYKVRRFNWFLYSENQDQFDVNYAMNDDLGKMVLNPDVTVRSRGVMEKCSMCVQRLQYGKLEAKKQSRPVKDGEILTACAQACETGAIAFGDANDSDSQIAKAKKNERMYYLLDEVGTQPSVFYQTKVRNKA